MTINVSPNARWNMVALDNIHIGTCVRHVGSMLFVFSCPVLGNKVNAVSVEIWA